MAPKIGSLCFVEIFALASHRVMSSFTPVSAILWPMDLKSGIKRLKTFLLSNGTGVISTAKRGAIHVQSSTL